MTDSQLTTGWICIATEGTTIDSRKIESQWLLDMAEPMMYALTPR
ncbi:hypothetical protein [Yersinia intermedia]|nr:hypothetical protein [Yersinia intermedia]